MSEHFKLPLNTGEVRPKEVSQTVSIGESVTFFVEKDQHVDNLRWRHDGSEPIAALDDQTQHTIPSVTLDDAGIYECHKNHARGTGGHAIFQLVVRGTLLHFGPHNKGRF